MVSDEFNRWAERMATQPPPPDDETLIEQRTRIDSVMGALPLAPHTTTEAITLRGVPAIRCSSEMVTENSPIVLYLHGGGFRTASALSYRSFCSHIARQIDGTVIPLDYRLAPENPYPAALEDVLMAYQELLDQDVAGRRLVVAGDSSGGGLAASMFLRTKADRLPAPAGLVCISPWLDLTVTAPSYETNAGTDQMFSADSARDAAALYLDGQDAHHPHASPRFGSWAGAPPILVLVSDAEVLFDDAQALAAAAEAEGVDITLRVAADMPHIWPINHPAFPEATEAVEEIGAFVRRVTLRAGV